MAFVIPFGLLSGAGAHLPKVQQPHAPGTFTNVIIRVNFKANNRKIKLMFDQLAPHKRVYEAIRNDPVQGDYIRVEKERNLRLNFILSDDWDWTYFTEYAFTLKTESDAYYYHIADYNPDEGIIVVDVTSSGAEPDRNQTSEVHDNPFNIFFVMEQESGKRMPVMFDPVIKNPPPDGG